MKKGQSNRLTEQQKEGQGPVTIFHKDAKFHDAEVGSTSELAMIKLKNEFSMLKFRYRKNLSKKEINEALKKIDDFLGQTLFLEKARIKPDGGIIEVQDDNGKWRVVLVSEAKHQGKDIENIRAGKLVGKKNDKDLMPAGNVIERAYKNVNFLTQNVNVTRPDGRIVTLVYNDGTLNRIDRLTAANYGMPINTNLCENRFVKSNGANIMLQAASIYTKGDGEHWAENDMVEVMLDVARTSLKMLGKDLFNQLTKK